MRGPRRACDRRGTLISLDEGGAGDEADAGFGFGQADEPEPAFAAHEDGGVAGGRAGEPLDVFEMLEVGDFLEVRIGDGAASVEVAADEGAVAGGVDQDLRH